jgi:hypothetical protein
LKKEFSKFLMIQQPASLFVDGPPSDMFSGCESRPAGLVVMYKYIELTFVKEWPSGVGIRQED